MQWTTGEELEGFWKGGTGLLESTTRGDLESGLRCCAVRLCTVDGERGSVVLELQLVQCAELF